MRASIIVLDGAVAIAAGTGITSIRNPTKVRDQE